MFFYYFKCSHPLLGCFKQLATLSFWLCISLICSWIHIEQFLNAISTLMALQYNMLSLTFPWLDAFSFSLQQKGLPVFHICIKISRFLPQTAPTSARGCSGDFSHWKSAWKIIFTFQHWYTGRKQRSCYFMIHFIPFNTAASSFPHFHSTEA